MSDSKRTKAVFGFVFGFVGFVLVLSVLAEPINQVWARARWILLLAVFMWICFGCFIFSILDYLDPEKT